MRAESRLSRRRLLQGTAAGTAIAAARTGTRFTPSARAQGNVTLTFWSEYSTDPARSTMDDAIKAFQDANPGITVDHRPIENEQFFTVLRTGFTSGEPPDMFQHEGHQNLFQFSDQGEIEAIDDLYADLEERFIPGTAAAISKDGHYYGVPWSIHTDTQIFHNETVLQANGIDPATLKTWDDYLATFAALKEVGSRRSPSLTNSAGQAPSGSLPSSCVRSGQTPCSISAPESAITSGLIPGS
jgi:ABC-type glycerol-3-phosphate transport system substrate-binding protein